MMRNASGESGKAALFALAAAVLYAFSMPLSKRLLLLAGAFFTTFDISKKA